MRAAYSGPLDLERYIHRSAPASALREGNHPLILFRVKVLTSRTILLDFLLGHITAPS